MKYSYQTLKKIIPFVESPEQVAQDIIMHIAEVEGVELEGDNLKDVYVGKVIECHRHPDSEKLNVCRVEILGEEKQIVCGAPNVRAGIKVPVAIVGAKLGEDFVIEKTKLRGETSEGMICSEDELGLVEERQKTIMELDENAKMGMSMREYLGKNDAIIEIDNKGINHRPDMFSHVGLAREIAAINKKEVDLGYEKNDFTKENPIVIENEITDVVKRYIGLSISGVANVEAKEDIKQVVNVSGNTSKGLLVDVTNYSLYLYGQPTHCFDADKIAGNIVIRYAKDGEEFKSLDSKTYKLTSEDIVIADKEKVIALGGVIGGANSAVSNTTKNIIIEGAWFNPKTVRKTGRRHGIRTDSLNVFEKDVPLDFPIYGVSLIYRKLKEYFPGLKIEGYCDVYPVKQETKKVAFDLDFVNNLIGANYSEKESLEILGRLGIFLDSSNSVISSEVERSVEEVNNEIGKNNVMCKEQIPPFQSEGQCSEELQKTNSKNCILSPKPYLIVPFWRKDINYKADIAEEVSRIYGFDKIVTTIPRINLGAIIQDNIYKLKNDVRDFFVDNGYYDLYNYSFVNEEQMKKLLSGVENLVPLKNSLSEDQTHMKGSLIPNLMISLEKNIRQTKSMKLFEFEKVFNLLPSRHSSEGVNLSDGQNTILENYNFAGVVLSDKDLVYYDLQKVIADLFKKIQIDNFMFANPKYFPTFAHKGRTASIIVRGQEVGFLGEIHPFVANNFSIGERIGFFEINADKLKTLVYNKVKAKEVSSFQENNFDLSFVVPKEKAGKEIQISIAKTDPKIIQKVELFDIYENEEKLPGKRSLSFKIYIQSLEGTLGDDVKNNLIKSIIERVAKIGGELR